ncbi:MAG: hypothetical protein E7417_05600 [Ruminococcaceae bacterium]|nr:hypothetical protein [Oscillospiraceae bacterium]
MGKFMLSLTKGNERKILSICETKEEAIAKGNDFIKNLPRDAGVLSVIYGEPDDFSSQSDSIKYMLYKSWF